MAIHVLSSPANRAPRRISWLLVAALVAAALGSCGDSAEESEGDADDAAATTTTESATTETTASETTISEPADDTTSTSAGEGGSPEDLVRLAELIDATVARDSALFSLEVVQTLPVAAQDQASILRTGSFDDTMQTGVGTQQLVGGSATTADEIEHRLVNGTYWLSNPATDPPSWIGYELDALTEVTTSDPLLSINGDHYLLLVNESITSVTEIVEFDDGSEGWTVQLAADELLPIVVTSGVRDRLTTAGLQPTGLEATASVAVDPTGMVIGLIADLDEWWQGVIEQTLGEVEAPPGMVVQFQIGDFDTDVDVEVPCSEPEELLEADAPPALICES